MAKILKIVNSNSVKLRTKKSAQTAMKVRKYDAFLILPTIINN